MSLLLRRTHTKEAERTWNPHWGELSCVFHDQKNHPLHVERQRNIHFRRGARDLRSSLKIRNLTQEEILVECIVEPFRNTYCTQRPFTRNSHVEIRCRVSVRISETVPSSRIRDKPHSIVYLYRRTRDSLLSSADSRQRSIAHLLTSRSQLNLLLRNKRRKACTVMIVVEYSICRVDMRCRIS